MGRGVRDAGLDRYRRAGTRGLTCAGGEVCAGVPFPGVAAAYVKWRGRVGGHDKPRQAGGAAHAAPRQLAARPVAAQHLAGLLAPPISDITTTTTTAGAFCSLSFTVSSSFSSSLGCRDTQPTVLA